MTRLDRKHIEILYKLPVGMGELIDLNIMGLCRMTQDEYNEFAAYAEEEDMETISDLAMKNLTFTQKRDILKCLRKYLTEDLTVKA